MTKHLETVDEVIQELGGPKAVANLLPSQRSSASRVPMWKHRKQFPTKTIKTLQQALRAKGATAPDSLWGL